MVDSPQHNHHRAPPYERSSRKITAIHHLAMNCIDLKAQEEFYSRHFGFRRVRTFNPGLNEFVMIRLGEVCIELFNAGSHGSERGGEQMIGYKHLCLAVDDMSSTVEQLQNGGVEVGEIVDRADLAEQYKYCFLSDPEGALLELIQGYVDELTILVDLAWATHAAAAANRGSHRRPHTRRFL